MDEAPATMRQALSLFLLFALFACGGSTPTSPTTPDRPPGVADPGFLAQYASTGGFRLGQPTAITLTPDGGEVLFLRSGPRDAERDLYAFDVATGAERVVLTAAQILDGAEERLSPEERALRERLRMTARGIASYQLSRDGRRILVPLSGKLYVVERATGEVKELPSEGGYANDARFSPDGELVGCVRQGDLWVIDVDAGRQRRLTTRPHDDVTNGLAEFVAQEEMGRYRGWWWAPDSSAILFQRTDTRGVEMLYASNPIDPSEPPHAARYPRAGTDNAVVSLHLVSVRSGDPADARQSPAESAEAPAEASGEAPVEAPEPREIRWDRARFPYLAAVRWSRGAPPTLLVQDRRQQVERLLAVDVSSGATRTLHEETDDAWLNLDASVPVWLRDDDASEGAVKRFLWSTERGGRWQLEVRDERGEARTLTPPELGYWELLHVDHEAGEAWVVASADPTERHLWRVPLEGDAAPTRVTEAPGFHTGTFARAGDVWVHASHTVEEGPRWRVRRGGEVVGELRSVAEAPPFRPNVEHLQVGERGYHAVVVRPRNFEPGRRYPVLLSVYAGPGFVRVRKGRDRQLREQWQADHGFIVVSLDGRGTPGRGREWERAIRGNVIDVPLEDQIEGLRALGQRFEEMDLSRVGVYGWSFGGYFSAMAVMRRPDVFDVGVAGAPVCDWADYDTHYTERFMGLPAENAAGYEAANVLTHAPRLERPLMVIHGTSDDNVYFVHALKMSDALLRAGRPHEFVPLAGSTHMVADPAVAQALQGRIMDFLRDGLE
ncbi:MAG TPA: DPP IV N-terminal domain-containing protein [Polyangiaceae bacterium LLY-WYZ-15_(1-7)]|nr:peptidase [Myxococcales bacterium]MAT26513.1 peptidase [Sandaracinus sp.]HJL03046.1 DPP IV N-terminal domain-containing protein [Polyangiaceae bacterium LLY-WYZ-15_(1-7)]MBJ70416.1 peptidase [Sandaracinus sp.]HJL10242.1 DPP IV N-terminal domain-containing protein [Polyangiaceae bacterium LLY-WYZ-15_(1-7)]